MFQHLLVKRSNMACRLIPPCMYQSMAINNICWFNHLRFPISNTRGANIAAPPFSTVTSSKSSPRCHWLVCCQDPSSGDSSVSGWNGFPQDFWLQTFSSGDPTFVPAMAMSSLASRWEGDAVIRRMVRENKALCRWRNPKLAGVASCEAAAFNINVLCHVTEWWAGQVDSPQAIPIDLLRTEAGNWTAKMLFTTKNVLAQI